MPVTINTSNIFIDNGTSNYIVDMVRVKTKNKIIKNNTPDILPALNSKYSYNDSSYNYLNFVYNDTIYPFIDADNSDLIVWWKFDNNSLFYNSAPNPILLVVTSRTNTSNDGIFTIKDKYVGTGSLYKSDHNDIRGYNITPDNWLNSLLDLEVTFTFWVKQTYSTSTGIVQHIFSQDDSFIIRQYGTKLQVYIAPDNWAYYDYASGFHMPYYTWTHLAVVINLNAGTDKQDVVNVYKNGILLPTILNTTGSTYNGLIGVGFNNDTSTFRFLSGDESNNNQGYRGYLDDFRIYKKALTGADIYNLYNQYHSTQYNVNFVEETTCDILVVGAGGGGSRRMGGGGGAGALIFDTYTFRANQDYKFKIGKGGMGVEVSGNIGGSISTAMKIGEIGGSTEIIVNDSPIYKAIGGGGGQGGKASGGQHAGEGGSGGGAGGQDYLYGGLISRDNIVNGGTVAVNSHFISSSRNPSYMSDKIFGNEGGRGNGNSDNLYGGGGGGGAGARGADSNSSNPNKNNVNKGGDGLSGIRNIDFVKHFSIKNKEIGHHYNGKTYFAGGGGGGNWTGYIYYNDGGLGGGGRSGMRDTLRLSNIDGKPNTGGGGGGDGYDKFQGGNGGSGIILLRYKLDYVGENDYSAQWMHNKTNTSLHTYSSVGIGTEGTDKYSLMVNGDINFTGELYRDGGIIETPKHIVETSSFEDITYTILSGERLYPSQYARQNYFNKIDGLSPDIYSIFDNNNYYGNGIYTINYSSRYSGDNNSPHYIFHKPYPINSSYSDDSNWEDGQYSSGNYTGHNSIAGIKGDWITIQMPCKILLTKYIFIAINYTNTRIDRLPRKYSIFGCNNGDNNWEKIYQENLPDDDSLFSHTYINQNDSYFRILYDNDRLTGNKLFDTFCLVVEKIGNASVLAMAEWNLYGKEEIILNQKPFHKYIRKYPLINSTLSSVLNSDYSRAIWNDNGYVIKAKSSNILNDNHGIYELFNGINNTYNDCYRSSESFDSYTPYNYTSSTTFKGTSGDYITLDVGRSINPVYMSIMPRSNTDYSDNGAYLNGCPGKFKIYASNDADCYDDPNHSSWIEIYHQAEHLFSNSYSYNTFTDFKLINVITTYRYYTLVTTHLSGNYNSLTLSDWRIFGGELLNTNSKYLTFHYDDSGDFADNVTSNNYSTINDIIDGLMAHYKFDGNYNDSSGTHNLTNVNTSFTSTNAIDGSAVEFNMDNNNYLEFPDTINPYTIWLNNGITFSFWFKLETNENSSFDDYVALIDFSDGSGIDDNRLFIALYKPDETNLNLRNLYFRINDTNITVNVNKNTIDLSQYTLISWAIDLLGNWHIYINGELKSSSITKIIPNMTFTYKYINNNSNNDHFNGYLDDFRIYERSLTKSEINLIYLKHINRNLIAHFDFNTDSLSDSNEREYPPTGKRDFVPTNNTDLEYSKYISNNYGEGYYTITVSSINIDNPTHNPIKIFNDADSARGLWKSTQYVNTTGVYFDSKFNNNNGKINSLNYKGDWIQIELPVKIKLTKYKLKQKANAVDSLNSPGNYKIFGSNNERDWTELVNKSITTSDYSNWIYEDTSISSTNYYKYFILIVNKLVGSGENADNLILDEWYIYGIENCKSYLNTVDNNYLIAKNNSTIIQVDGIINKAIKFNNDYDILSSINNFPEITSSSTYSYSIWVKRNIIDFTDFIFSQGVSSSANEIGLFIDSNNKINFYVFGNDILTTESYIDTSRYIHIVTIINNNNISLYINGAFYSTISVSANISEGILYIGSRGSDRTRLSIDEFRIYDRPLNLCDVYGLYKDLYQKYGQSQYELTFNEDTECDILIVGGGGGAGGTHMPVIEDISEINSTSPEAFSYIAMPRVEETLLSYITHFGIVHNSINDNSTLWSDSHSGDIEYVASPITNNEYFTLHGRVRIIDGDGQTDANDWAIFNFGEKNATGDFDGKNKSSGYGYFGGESTYSGGTGGFSDVSKGHIWGYNTAQGWKLLYELSLPGNSSHNHKNQYWWRTGGIVTSGLGKRQEYDNLKITHLGFSVSDTSHTENPIIIGGGGGSGDVLYYNNVNFSAGNYIINVGGGGDNGYIKGVTNAENNSGCNGFNSSIKGNDIEIISAGGGGGGGLINSPALDGTLLSYINPLNEDVEYSSGGGGGNIQDYPKASGNNYSGDGGNNTLSSRTDDSFGIGGGGGGAGGMNNKGLYADAPNDTAIENRGLGGSGIINDITGAQFKYGYGGSGSGYSLNGQSGTGNGGHGGSVRLDSKLYGNGGSGIVIIKFKTKYTEPSYSLTQWTYKHGDDNVYHMGNVGIGTSNPTTMLDVTGDITGNTKNFKIEHPLLNDKWLFHGTVEAPRYENIYRGKKLLKNGKCSVNIDRECNESGGMIPGTFVALNKNIQLYLQNNHTYDKVIGVIIDGIIRISCQNTIEDIEIDWMVIGERKDGGVINEPITDDSGALICEHYIPGYNDFNVDN
jgi:hypothetical protein